MGYKKVLLFVLSLNIKILNSASVEPRFRLTSYVSDML